MGIILDLNREWDKDGKLIFEEYYWDGNERCTKEEYEEKKVATKNW